MTTLFSPQVSSPSVFDENNSSPSIFNLIQNRKKSEITEKTGNPPKIPGMCSNSIPRVKAEENLRTFKNFNSTENVSFGLGPIKSQGTFHTRFHELIDSSSKSNENPDPFPIPLHPPPIFSNISFEYESGNHSGTCEAPIFEERIREMIRKSKEKS